MSERARRTPEQLSFLAPEDVELLTMMRRFMAEASRLYETHPGRSGGQDALTIRQPRDVYELLRLEMGELAHEQTRTVNLNTRHQVLSAPMLYQGTINGAHVRIAEIFRPAIIANAAALVVAHNHPSGNPEPSAQDTTLTRSIVKAGRLLDIDVLDHIIVAGDRFVSLRERGLGFD